MEENKKEGGGDLAYKFLWCIKHDFQLSSQQIWETRMGGIILIFQITN